MSAILRRQSSKEDLYSLHFGQAVAIYDLTRSDADGICSTYKRVFVSAAKSVPHPTTPAAMRFFAKRQVGPDPTGRN
jgi:hypothetical protein